MDPDANLAEQRSIAADIVAIWDSCPENGTWTADQSNALLDHALRLAELVQALDGWITGHGFLPREWRKVNRR